jgi:beta-glucanase (GH16 family)
MPFITIQKGKKTHIKITAKLPIARDVNGSAIPGVPLWPALWLLGSELNLPAIDWPFCGEIDIMEFAYNNYDPDTYNSAVHYADNLDNHTFESELHKTTKNLTETFNDFEVIIYAGTDSTQNKIDILFNSVKIHTYDGNSINKELFEAQDGSDVKYYDLLFNIAIAGDFVGAPWIELTMAERLSKILDEYPTWNSVSEMVISNLSVTMEDYVV